MAPMTDPNPYNSNVGISYGKTYMTDNTNPHVNPNVNPFVSNDFGVISSPKITLNYPTGSAQSEGDYEMAITIGDGKSTNFAVAKPSASEYPRIDVYKREVEKDDADEVSETLTVLHPEIVITDDTVAITFVEAPAKKSVVVVIR